MRRTCDSAWSWSTAPTSPRRATSACSRAWRPSGGRVRAINAKKGGEHYSRRGIDALTEYVAQFGAKGLAWFKVEADGTLQSTIAKNFKPELLKEIGTRLKAEPGDLLLFVADTWKVTCKALYALRHEDRQPR